MRESSGEGRIAVTTGVKRRGWAGLALALLLPVCAAWGANPATPGVQVVSNETYTLTLTANPDQTAICRGKPVTFTASLRCNDPDGAANSEKVIIDVVPGFGSGADVSGYGSVSTPVTGTQPGDGKIAVTAAGGGLPPLSRSIDVISVVIESGGADCVHKAAARLEIDADQSHSPNDGYGWSVEPEEGLDHSTGLGLTFDYYPTNSQPGAYAVTARSITLPDCKDTRAVNIVKVDLAVAGVADEDEADAPGGLVCVTNGPGQTATRIALAVSCQPTDWDGRVELLWAAGNVKVYNAATGGVEVTSGTTFANAALPTNLWVEGTAPSAAAGDVVFRLNPVGIDCPQAAEGCDRVVMTAVKVELITPAGDPVASPVDSGDGQNEFTFSTANPGVLTMHLKAHVMPSGIASQVQARVYFTVDGIGSSTMAWDAANLGGKPTASGSDLLATVTFTNLPANNSDFGAKKAAVYLDGDKRDEADYEVFFAKDAVNHPGGQPRRPNWYFYWSQTLANKANTAMAYTNTTRSYYDYFAGRTIYIANDAALSQIAVWGTPKGIDCFAWTTAHEAKHHTQLTCFWPINWIASEDTDTDWLPNSQETTFMPGRAYSPTNAATFPDTIGYGQNPIPDVEDINMRSQTSPYNLDQLWINGSADDDDWANPGKQSTVTY